MISDGSLINMYEYVNYQEAMVDHKVTKREEAKHQSMYDNHK